MDFYWSMNFGKKSFIKMKHNNIVLESYSADRRKRKKRELNSRAVFYSEQAILLREKELPIYYMGDKSTTKFNFPITYSLIPSIK